MPRSPKNNIINVMMKIVRIPLLSALCLTLPLYASLAENLRKDIVSETPLVRRRAVYTVIHSTLPPSSAINLLSIAAGDEDLLVRRLAVSGISRFSALFDDLPPAQDTAPETETEAEMEAEAKIDLSDPVISDVLTEDVTAQQKLGLAGSALDILKSALSDSAAVIRADAVRVLGELPASISGEYVLAMLDDSSFLVVKEALRAAANLRLPEAAEKLDKLLKHKGEIVRVSAVEFAGDMRLDEYFKQLQRISSRDKSVEARRAALRAMVKIRPQERMAVLKDYLSEKDMDVALEAAFLLARDSDDSGRKTVFAALDSKEPALRLAAARVLLYYDDEESLERFRALLNDSDSDVRNFAERNIRREQ